MAPVDGAKLLCMVADSLKVDRFLLVLGDDRSFQSASTVETGFDILCLLYTQRRR